MNQIPAHLKGLSAAEIVQQIRVANAPCDAPAYMAFLEMHLLIAIKDALCACDDAEWGLAAAEGRAIAFLNMICPDMKER